MSFLNPVILFGLFAASLPILIHLFTRTKSRTIPFSTLAFLKEMQNQQMRRLRLRQILLLILRTLILILLIAAFARPTLTGPLSAMTAPNAKTSMAIVLDNSVSMTVAGDGTSLFARAKARVDEIAALLHPGDEAYILTTTDTATILARPFHDRDMLRRAAAEVKINFKLTDISSALDFASRLLATRPNINKEIYLVSDMQETGFRTDSPAQRADDIRLFGLPLAAESTLNLAIEHVELASTLLEQGKVAQAAVTIANTGDRDVDNSLVRLFVNEKPVAQLVMQLDAGAAQTDVLRFTLDKTGFSTARVVLQDDDLLDDNERAFSFYVPEVVTIGLSGFRPKDTFYASLVLDPKEIGPRYYALKDIPMSDLRYVTLSDFDVLLLSNIPSFDAQSAEKLKLFVEDGGGLILILGESIDIRAYNSALAPALTLPPFIDVIGSLDGERSDFSLGQYDLNHPIFAGVFETQDALIAPPRFHFAVKASSGFDIDAIMKYSNGDPLLFEKKLGQGTILVMTTGFDAQLSDITHRTIFAPLLTRMVGYAGSAGTHLENTLAVGDEIRLKISPQYVNQTLEMLHPGQKYDRLRPTMAMNDAWIEYSQTEMPGIYELLADGTVLQVWSVHLDARESDVRSIDLKTLQDRFNVHLIDSDAPLADDIVSRRYGQELWKYFAIAALLLLLAEMLLFREKKPLVAEKTGPE
ncbi:BatA domain-containing protein [candidate division KSB1 bacterium]|nr:BatA domain-containing protein [candidate division KSB1 bacterium]RQW05293.1 MAG: VWA domain-containing protein [candidate division KSB1 bacterium]